MELAPLLDNIDLECLYNGQYSHNITDYGCTGNETK